MKRFLFFKSSIYTFVGLTFLVIACSVFAIWYQNLPSPWQNSPPYSTQILSQEGKPLRFFTTDQGYWRFPANVDGIDKKYIEALVAYEDKRFYQHAGVDFVSLIRAIGQLIYHRRIISGASTLSMQTIRLLQPGARSVGNKFREMVQALRMESELNKQQILSLYLNLAPFGGNIQGIQAASYFYFGKPAKRLTYSEIALLIALPQSPESRRPDRHNQLARIARDRVLQRLLEDGIIESQDYDLALQQSLPRKRFGIPFYAPHMAQALKKMATPANRYRVQSSIIFPMQLKLQQLLSSQQEQLPYGETIAALVVDNRDCRVVAHMGSGDYWKASQLDLTRAIRSPGSTLKPFIYGLGFENKLFHPQTWVMDQPLRLSDGYGPQNFNQKFYGRVSLRKALRKSLNIPAIKALKRVGVENFLNRLQRVGIRLRLPKQQQPGLAIALGGAGISLENLAALYSALANQGQFCTLSYLASGHDNGVKKINSRSNKSVVLPDSAHRSRKEHNPRILSAQASWYLDEILKGVTKPEGYQSFNSLPIRFKTGTSYGYRDVWTIGYNARYTVALWRGRPDGGFTQNQSGLAHAAPFVFDIFNQLATPFSQAPFHSAPDGVSLPGNQQLPVAMQWLDQASVAYLEPTPIIQYPLDGSLIELAQQPEPVLMLKAQSGTPPYFWLVNGRFQQSVDNSSEYSWPVDKKGKVRITLIDSKGQQAYSEIHLK